MCGRSAGHRPVIPGGLVNNSTNDSNNSNCRNRWNQLFELFDLSMGDYLQLSAEMPLSDSRGQTTVFHFLENIAAIRVALAFFVAERLCERPSEAQAPKKSSWVWSGLQTGASLLKMSNFGGNGSSKVLFQGIWLVIVRRLNLRSNVNFSSSPVLASLGV